MYNNYFGLIYWPWNLHQRRRYWCRKTWNENPLRWGKSGLVTSYMIEWYWVFFGITYVRLSIICTHLHSSVWRSQVQFVGLHSWGGSLLSQNIRASVTALEFSSIGQRTIVTDQELQNHTHLPQNVNNTVVKTFIPEWRTPSFRDLVDHTYPRTTSAP